MNTVGRNYQVLLRAALCIAWLINALAAIPALAQPASCDYQITDVDWSVDAAFIGAREPHPEASMLSNIYVDANTGSDTNDGSQQSPLKTITKATTVATGTGDAPTTIYVAAGTYSAADNGEAFPINMKSWISIIGEGAEVVVLDAGGSSIVVNISSVSGAALSGCTIKGGSGNNGGGVVCNNSQVTISGNHITENTADSGAGIYCLGKSPVIQENIISSNTATGRLGMGGGIFTVSASPQILDNVFSGNSGDMVGA
ncbi:MAG: DUF1565 domain-containing protein, partial [Candidatus Coatesbacteria bacterium]|nr:DUF1565 domain-containing protein [Candidatus Coatesbacteria bacterium]